MIRTQKQVQVQAIADGQAVVVNIEDKDSPKAERYRDGRYRVCRAICQSAICRDP
jgi:hypothetical protein